MGPHIGFGKWSTATEVAACWGEERIKGRVVVITGVAPNSIGAALALALASQHPRLIILASRTLSKMKAVTQDIHSKFRDVNVLEIVLDLSSLRSVRAAAGKVKAITASEQVGIDVLFNNAGINISERKLSEDGVEMQFATNHLGPFLFTNLVLPLMLSSSDGGFQRRIVNTSSEAHRISPVRFSDINLEPGRTFDVPEEEQPRRGLPKGILRGGDRYEPNIAYGQSKSANVLCSVYLTEKFAGRGVRSFAVMPGTIKTNIMDGLDEEGLRGLLRGVPDDGWKSSDQGAATLVVSGFDPALDGESGVYLEDCQMRRPSKWASSTDRAEKLWKLSRDMISAGSSKGSRL